MRTLPSSFFSKSAMPYWVLLVLTVPLFFMGVTDVHSWGDDYAQYIKEAQNLAHGLPYYKSGYIYNAANLTYAPPQYPPGFPLLLAPVVLKWGLAIRPMLYLQTALCVLLAWSLYAWFRRYAHPVTALCLSLIIVYSWPVMDMKRAVLADITCLLLVVQYLSLRADGIGNWRRALLLGLVAAAASLVRSQAILLVAAEILWCAPSILRTMLSRSRNYSTYSMPLLTIVAGGAFYLLATKVLFPAPGNANDFYARFFGMTIDKGIRATLRDNLHYLLLFIKGGFHYPAGSVAMSRVIDIIGIAAVCGCVAGWFLSVFRKWQMADAFFITMCLLVLLMPVQDSRYFLPAVPLVFYYCYVSFKLLWQRLFAAPGWPVAVIAPLLFAVVGWHYFRDSIYDPCEGCVPTPREQQAFSYVRSHITDKDVIAFAKPRFLALYTGKRSMHIAWTVPFDRNKQIFDSAGVNYMLIVDHLDDGYFRDYLRQYPAIDSVQIASTYTLYRLH